MNLQRSRALGFTLLEVLVAAVILFSCVMSITLVYRTSLLSAEKAIGKLQQASIVPSTLELVQLEMRRNNKPEIGQIIKGNGEQFGIPYYFNAQVIKLASPPDKLDYSTGGMEKYPNKFVLYKVTLEIGIKAKLIYEYNEIAWL
ncbi:PulJ/GspJ family protein [Pseudoalteromonas xiamenensis]